MTYDVATGDWIYTPPESTTTEVIVEIDETITPTGIWGFRDVAVKIQIEHIAIGRNVYTEIGNVEGDPGIRPNFRIIDIDTSNMSMLVNYYSWISNSGGMCELNDKQEWLYIDSIITPQSRLKTYYVLK
jgi:hypothetical protein